MRKLYLPGLILIYLAGGSILHAGQWIQKGETAFAEGETSDVEITGVGASATLNLSVISEESLGNNFIITDRPGFKMDDVDYAISFRFRPEEDMNVDKILFFRPSVTPSPPKYTIGLQTADENWRPSGTWLSSSTFTPGASTTYFWEEVSIPEKPLASGTIYHVVIEGHSEFSGSNYMEVGYTSPANKKFPNSAQPDTIQNVLLNSSGGWLTQEAQPVFVLDHTDNSEPLGNPYTRVDDRRVRHPWWQGEEFSPRENITISKVGFYVRGRGDPPDDLYVVLRDKTAATVIEDGLLVRSNEINPYYSWFTYDFSSTISLDKNRGYQIYLKSPDSDSDNCYEAKFLSISDQSADFDFPSLLEATYGGTDFKRFYRDGYEAFTFDGQDMVFEMDSAIYETGGNFISGVFDAGSHSEFTEISWEPQTQPSPTSVKFRIASANSPDGPWDFSGPDGTSSSYYTDASGGEISSLHTGKRYLRYKAFFQTSDPGYSPSVSQVSVTYFARPLSGAALEARNTPNPFDPLSGETTIRYILEKDSRVTVEIYTLVGDLVREMSFSPGSEGGRGEADGYENRVQWDGRSGAGMVVASGVYLCRIIAEPADNSKTVTDVRKIGVVK